MTRTRRFSATDLELLREARIVGVRAGAEHRHTGVWLVVVQGRVFVRSWNDKRAGWYQAFRAEPSGSIALAAREIPVRAREVRSEPLRRAVTLAYGEKYDTKAAQKWVRGFAAPAREATTLELMPG